jgi:hypothetical protein
MDESYLEEPSASEFDHSVNQLWKPASARDGSGRAYTGLTPAEDKRQFDAS